VLIGATMIGTLETQIRKAMFGLFVLIAMLFCGSNAVPQSSQQNPPASHDNAETHLGRGYEALKQDRYDAAVTEFRAALALDPKLVLRAQFPLAVALFELHKPEEARKEFEAVRLEAGDHPNILYYLGRLDLEDHKFASAIHNLSEAAVNPPFPDTAYYLGFAYFKNGDFPSAEKWLKQAAEADPRDARIPYQLGLVYRKQGREDEAKQAFALSDSLHQQDDREGRLRVECGQKLDQGPREEARKTCEQLYNPDNAEKLMTLGTIYAQHGDLEDALKPLQRAAELQPQSPQMQYNLALAYFQLKRFEDARTPLAGALKRWPDLFQLNALYGAVLFKLGENSEAYRALQHSHQLNPEDALTRDMLYDTTMRLAESDKQAKRYSEALRYLAEASKLRPQEPEPHRLMAQVYKLTARNTEAAAAQQEADRLQKNAPQ
jgi:tetratricopeptide (TPR) repeat protein